METLTPYLPNFLFIFLRAGIVLLMLPFFGSMSFPPQFKIGIIVAISALLTPIVEIQFTRAMVPVMVVREVMFGMVFGLASRFVLYAVDVAGSIMSTASGLSIGTTFSPDFGSSLEISRLYSIIAMLLFLAMDIHHDLIAVFVRSYEWVPVGTANMNGLVEAGVSFSTKIFVIALKLSAPVVIIMLITNILMGFIYKAAPQMNIFFVGFPVYIFLGLLTMIIGLSVFATVMGGYFNGIKDDLGRVLMMMKS